MSEFGELLRSYRERIPISRNALAKLVPCDTSYLTRIEAGDREPPRPDILESLCRALQLHISERNRLFVLAGHAPISLARLGAWDDSLQDVLDVLNDPDLSDSEKTEFKAVIRVIARRYHPNLQSRRLRRVSVS